MDYYKYADIPNNLVPNAPYRLENAIFFNFVVACDEGKLNELITRRLTKAANFNVRLKAVSPYLSIIFAWYPSASSVPEKYEVGFTPYQEVIFMTMVQEQRPFWAGSSRVYSYQPLLFLDNNTAITTGREVFGWSKIMADIAIPGLDKESSTFKCEGIAFSQIGAGDSLATRQTFVEIEPPPAFLYPDIRKQFIGDPETLIANWLYKTLQEEKGMNDRLSELTAKIQRLPVITLRQLRDLDSLNTAVNKDVLKSFQKNLQFTNAGMLPGGFHLKTLIDTPMYPLKSLLGVNPRILAAYWFEWSFDIHRGEVLWGADHQDNRWLGSILDLLGW